MAASNFMKDRMAVGISEVLRKMDDQKDILLGVMRGFEQKLNELSNQVDFIMQHQSMTVQNPDGSEKKTDLKTQYECNKLFARKLKKHSEPFNPKRGD